MTAGRPVDHWHPGIGPAANVEQATEPLAGYRLPGQRQSYAAGRTRLRLICSATPCTSHPPPLQAYNHLPILHQSLPLAQLRLPGTISQRLAHAPGACHRPDSQRSPPWSRSDTRRRAAHSGAFAKGVGGSSVVSLADILPRKRVNPAACDPRGGRRPGDQPAHAPPPLLARHGEGSVSTVNVPGCRGLDTATSSCGDSSYRWNGIHISLATVKIVRN